MNIKKFLTYLALIFVPFIFLKIYQHNKIVNMGYKIQNTDRDLENKTKYKNSLLVQLFNSKDQKSVRKIAREKLGFRPMKPSQIVALSSVLTSSSSTN